MAQQEGKKIWVESLLTPTEWKEQSKIHPSVYNTDIPYAPFECEFRWRQGMGAPLTAQEIKIINLRLDYIKKEGGLK
jgi:hypothetical protein